MKTKNRTPFLFGAKVTSRQPPQVEMTMVVRGRFSLRPNEPVTPLTEGLGFPQGFLSGELFREEDEERAFECLYPGDFADYKLNAEVFFQGTCYPPGGRPVADTYVEFSVGAWSKGLRVVGRRVWTDAVFGDPFTAPVPFTSMPLTYANAFGGPAYALNPAGKGFDTPELPTVEAVGQPVRSRGDRPMPASFGPINPAWPQRAGKMGTQYGAKYKAERAPFYAEDFDWTYFSAAPLDQQLKGHLRGDEELCFINLHPTAREVRARLPGLRIRAFVDDMEGRFREVRLSLDTLHANLDEEVLTLTWRGIDQVKEQDLSDVRHVMVVSEPLAEAPQPLEYYRQSFLLGFEEDPLGVREALPPELAEMALQTMKGKPGAQPPPLDPKLDPVSAHLQQKLGSMAPKEQAEVQKAMASGGIRNAGKVLADAKPGMDLQAMMALGVAAGASAAPIAPVVPIKPGVSPRVPLRDAVQRMIAAGDKLKKLAAERGLPIEGLGRIDALANDPRLAALDPTAAEPALPEEEPGPYKDLHGRDFTDQDLRGRDLRGANLEGAIFTRAKLGGANLEGANLKYAVLAEAELDQANLSKADLTMANLAGASAPGVKLVEALLHQAFLQDANLAGADLRGASGEQTICMGVKLEGASAAGASFYQADFEGAKLERADFSRASLVRCLMARIEGAYVDMTGAQLSRTSFAGAHLEHARFTEARGETTIWMGAWLDHADFGRAILPTAHFTEVHGAQVSFHRAELREARFYRAELDRADFVEASLFAADFCRATLGKTKFTGANLYDAKFIDAAGAGCDFNGANLKASTLEKV